MKKLTQFYSLQQYFLLFKVVKQSRRVHVSKEKSTDEFLVEKKSPLVMPPEFNELPVPKSSENIPENETENNIEKFQIMIHQKILNSK